MMLGRMLALAVALLSACGFLAGPALAQAARPAERTDQLTGCWQTSTRLYSRYSIAFCMQPGGAGLYRVQGEGYDCQGRSTWRAARGNGRVTYQMARGSCGASANWTPDRIECDVSSGARARRGAGLACSYYPAADGYEVERFSAFRHPDS